MFLRRRPGLVVGLLLGLSLVVAGSAAAQQQGQDGGRRRGFGGGGPGGPGGGGEMSLLGNETVQKELELLPEQIADFGKLREESQTKMRELFSGAGDFGNLSDEERRAKFDEMRPKMEEAQKELRAKMREILLPHQTDRLRQIFIQVRGAGALDDAEVAESLKITDDQKKQMAEVRESQGSKMRELFQNREGSDEERRAKFQTAMQEAGEKVLAVLTPEQREQFDKMKGPEFAAAEEVRRSGFGGRGGPGGGPGGPGGPGGFRGRGPGGDRPQGDRPQGERPSNET